MCSILYLREGTCLPCLTGTGTKKATGTHPQGTPFNETCFCIWWTVPHLYAREPPSRGKPQKSPVPFPPPPSSPPNPESMGHQLPPHTGTTQHPPPKAQGTDMHKTKAVPGPTATCDQPLRPSTVGHHPSESPWLSRPSYLQRTRGPGPLGPHRERSEAIGQCRQQLPRTATT